MTKIYLFIWLLFISSQLAMAKISEDSVAIKKQTFQYYISPILDFNPLVEQYFSSAGLSAGLIYKSHYNVEIFAQSLMWDLRKRLIFPNDYALTQRQAGLVLQYIVNPDADFNFGFGAKGGVGYLAWDQVEGNDRYEDIVWVIRPQVFLEWSLSKYLKIGASAGYSHTSQLEIFGLDEGDLDGFSSSIYLKLGRFNKR
ncbi:MAG: hypothetical protein ACFCUU_01455 [Cyclobacteriaceae bacterium]